MNKMVDRESVRAMLAAAEAGHKQALADLAEAQERLQAYGSSVNGLRAWLTIIEKGDPGTGVKGSQAAGAAEAVATVNGHLSGWEPTFVRPREAILRLFDEAPGDWSLVQIEDTMRERKWLDPNLSRPTEAIRAAANRLVDVDHKLSRSGKSSYRLAIPDLLAEIQ